MQDLFSYKENPREKNGNNQRTVWRQGYFGLIKSTVRFEKWNDIIEQALPVYDKPEPMAGGTGRSAWRTRPPVNPKNQGGARRTAQISTRSTSAEEPLGIAAQELEATIAARAGDRKKAYIVRKAADRERTALYGAAGLSAAGGRRMGKRGARAERLRQRERSTARRWSRPGSGRAFFGLAASLQVRARVATRGPRGSAPPRRGQRGREPAQMQQLRTGTAAT